tara:strand:- start:12845 stop:15136 length:2292 start_codon:yes stop_codon:yes gene_type:complete
MALNNCTINSASVTVNQGQALSTTASQVLTITPDAGYVVAAADFTNNSGSLSGSPIASIAITDSHANPYHDDNTVLVTCDLDNNFVPNASINYIIDIDGDAKDKKSREYTIAGTSDATVSNASPSTYTGQAYNGAGIEGTIITLFEKTFEAATGKHFASEPTATVSTGTATNYIIEHEDTVNNNFFNRLIKRRFIVKYRVPGAFVAGDNIDFAATAVDIPATDNESGTSEIKKLVIDDSSIPRRGDTRVLKVYGTPTASFELTVTRSSDSNTYDFTSELDDKFTSSSTKLDNVTVGATGFHECYIVIPGPPANKTESFDIKVLAESGTTISSNITNYNNSNPNITLNQVEDITITLTTVNGSNVSSRTQDTLVGAAGDAGLGVDIASKTASFTVTSSANMFLARQPIFPDDFSNVDTNGNQFFLSEPTVTGSGGTTLTIAGRFNVGAFGSANTTSSLNLNNILSAAPTTSNFTSTGNEDTTQNINLATNITNPSGGTLTYSIVSDGTGSNGTLTLTSSSNGTVTYVPAANNNTNVSFTYKVNDGVQDSNTSTATVNVTAVNDAPTNIVLSAASIEEGNSIGDVIGSMQATDVDGSSHTFALVTGTGSTNNSSFSITGTSLKAAEVFDFSVKSSYSIRLRATDGSGGTFEKQFTISITEQTFSGARWSFDVYNAQGQATGATGHVSATSYCEGNQLSLMPGGCFSVGDYFRYVTTAGGCGTTSFAAGRITSQSVSNGTFNAYINDDKKYSSAANAHNNQFGINC